MTLTNPTQKKKKTIRYNQLTDNAKKETNSTSSVKNRVEMLTL